jgi:hypothetical protein
VKEVKHWQFLLASGVRGQARERAQRREVAVAGDVEFAADQQVDLVVEGAGGVLVDLLDLRAQRPERGSRARCELAHGDELGGTLHDRRRVFRDGGIDQCVDLAGHAVVGLLRELVLEDALRVVSVAGFRFEGLVRDDRHGLPNSPSCFGFLLSFDCLRGKRRRDDKS